MIIAIGCSRSLALLAVTSLLALAVTGCASSQHSTGNTTVTRTAAGATVEVILDEYKIHMPTTVPAGAVTLKVRNTGHHDHNIEIIGNGVDATLPQNLPPGQATELAVNLAPGKYRVICPVGPHEMLGMKLTLTVE